MSLDSFLIGAQIRELEPLLTGAHIDKISMPSPHEAVLSLHGENVSGRLMVSCGGANPGVYLTSLRPENPAVPPMLCMLLRKHMQGGRILSLSRPEGERMIVITFSAYDELGVAGEKRLVCELMGKRTNIVLLNEEGIILGCAKRSESADALRAVLPGLRYREPEAGDRPSVCAMDEAALTELISATAEAGDLPSRLAGVSPAVAREVYFRHESPEDRAGLLLSLARGGGRPFLIRRRGEDFDTACLELTHMPDCESIPRESFSALLDGFYALRREREHKKALSSGLARTLESARARVERRLGKQRRELHEARGREELKKQADLITANLYAIKSGDDRAEVIDYFTEGMPRLTIPLDPDLSPQQNAQLLYKRYARRKSAEEALTARISEGERELEYLDSLIYGLERARGEAELRDISEEAAQAGYLRLKSDKKTPRKPKAGAFTPKRYVTDGGFTLLRGRNNRENDRLTMRESRGGDLWFHARGVPGSHVVMVLENREPAERDIEQAAALAAFYSRSAAMPRAAVDYARVKDVKKPQGARAGMVNYFNFRTILIEPRDLPEL